MFYTKLQKYIEAGDTLKVSSLVISQLDEDRLQDPMDVERFQGKIPQEFFEDDNGNFTILMHSLWTPDYWTNIRVALLNNFSKEKLLHAIEVMKYLRAQGEADFQARIRREDASAKREQSRSAKHVKRGTVPVCVGTTVTGAVVGGFVASNAVVGAIVGAGLGLTVGVAYVVYSQKNIA